MSTEVSVTGEIRLGQFLKLAGAAESGAHARALLEDGEVEVNGAPETRRGRQLTLGDEISVAHPSGTQTYRVA